MATTAGKTISKCRGYSTGRAGSEMTACAHKRRDIEAKGCNPRRAFLRRRRTSGGWKEWLVVAGAAAVSIVLVAIAIALADF